MINNFKIIGIDDEFESGGGLGFVFGLEYIGNDSRFIEFGLLADGKEYYSNLCWRADVGVGETDLVDLLSYVDNEGRIIEYGAIDDDFRGMLLKYIKSYSKCK